MPGTHGRRKRKGASPFTDLGDALDREPERNTFEFHGSHNQKSHGRKGGRSRADQRRAEARILVRRSTGDSTSERVARKAVMDDPEGKTSGGRAARKYLVRTIQRQSR